MDFNEKFARIILARSERIGPLAFANLIRKFGTATKAVSALRQNPKQYSLASDAQISQEIENTAKIGGQILVWGEANYPQSLGNIPAPPPIISFLGHEVYLHKPAIAIVGARDGSANGLKLAQRFAQVLSQDWTIISGLARGIDTAAHEGALQNVPNSSSTIAVLAGGVDEIYPKENQKLYEKIKEIGTIVSEAPLGAKPLPKHFPKRNRIISGLSLGVLVVEAALQSGTLITAKFAAEQGRDVFAIPGSPLDSRMRGCNDLIRNGAHLCETPDDIEPILRRQINLFNEDKFDNYFDDQDFMPNIEQYSDNESESAKKLILEKLSYSPIHLDELKRSCGLMNGLFNHCILELELMGYIEYQAGNKYALLMKFDEDGKINGLF